MIGKEVSAQGCRWGAFSAMQAAAITGTDCTIAGLSQEWSLRVGEQTVCPMLTRLIRQARHRSGHTAHLVGNADDPERKHWPRRQPDRLRRTHVGGKFVYRKIEPQERIEFINSFSDEAGG